MALSEDACLEGTCTIVDGIYEIIERNLCEDDDGDDESIPCPCMNGGTCIQWNESR